MLNSVMLRNRKNLVGQKVCIEGNKYGIIKFYGETSFAEGVWCGIELDEGVGENNGMINNISYFTCRDNHGIFVSESEITIINTPTLESYLNDLSSFEPMSTLDNKSTIVNPKPELFCKFSVSNDSSPPRSILNDSFTISKGYYREEKLSAITEENSGHCYSCDMLHRKSFTGGTDLGKWESIFFTDQGSELVSVKLKDHECELKDEDIEGSCDSDESLGVLPPDLLDGLPCDSLIFDKEEPNRDLNVTVNLSYKHTENFNSHLLHELKSSDEDSIFSPVYNKLNISCSQTSESPIYCSSSMPVCASTPKHESNYSYIIDEKIISTEDMSKNFHISKKMQESYEGDMDLEFKLNRTTVIETALDSVTNMPASTYSESGENVNIGQNILNLTCMIKPMNTGETSLNKTFESLNVLADQCVLPTIMSHTDSHLINNLNIPNLRSDQHDAEEFNLRKENVLNLTCDIVRKLDDSESDCEAFSSNPESYETNILNTTHELDKTQLIGFVSKDKSDVNAGNTDRGRTGDLNTTYEKNDKSFRSDAGSETLKCITNLGESKIPYQLGTKINSNKTRFLSFSAKDTAVENKGFRNKSSMFNKNETMRKSVSYLGKTNVTKTEPSEPARRNSFSSHTYTSSKVPKTKISYPSAKSLPPNCSARDSKCSLANKERFDSCDLLNKTVKCSTSKLYQKKTEEMKSVSNIRLKSSQSSLLNETINLPPPVSDASKTVVKKPSNSMQISYPNKCFLDPCDASLGKNIETNTSFQMRPSVRIPSTKEGEMPKKSNEDKTSALSNKTGLKKPIMGEKIKISRLPQKILSQKNIHSNFQSSNENPPSNVTRPQSAISALMPPITRRNSQSSTSRKSLIQACELADRTTLNDTTLVSAQGRSKEESTRTLKHIPSSSKIPSISHLPRLQEKSSRVNSRRLESSIPKTFKSDLK